MLNGNKAELIGLLCAEGSYYQKKQSYWEYSQNRRKKYWRTNKCCVYLQFGNYNVKLLKWFQHLMVLEYGYYFKREWDRIRIGKREILRDLLQYYIPGGLHWRVPQEVMQSKELMPRFIRGYFEGDGCASGEISFTSINVEGLRQVQYLLHELSIESTLQGPHIRKTNKNKKTQYRLRVRTNSQKRFLEVTRPRFKPNLYKMSRGSLPIMQGCQRADDLHRLEPGQTL